MRISLAWRGRLLQPKRNEDGLGYPFIQRRYGISRDVILMRMVENSDNRGVAAAKHPDNSPVLPAVRPGWCPFHEHLVALHGAIHLVGRNEDVVVPAGLARFRADKPEAVAMDIQAAGKQVVAMRCLGKRPMIPVGLDEFPARGHAAQLFQQHAAFPASAQPQFPHQLFVAGALAGGTLNALEELAVSHSGYFWPDSHKSHQSPCLC